MKKASPIDKRLKKFKDKWHRDMVGAYKKAKKQTRCSVCGEPTRAGAKIHTKCRRRWLGTHEALHKLHQKQKLTAQDRKWLLLSGYLIPYGL